MNEKDNSQVEETQTNILQTEKIESNLQEFNSSVNELLKFFQDEKKEQIEKEKAQKIQEEKEQKIQEEEQIKIEEEQQKKEDEFLTNIETIAENTQTEVTTQLLQDVSTLMQVNIITSGLLIGIVCVGLLAKFFKR